MIAIEPARNDADVADVTTLAWEFVAFLQERYPERKDSLVQYLKEQRFEEMLADFRNFFNPPPGECMLARQDGAAVGIVMLKPLDDVVCEMNRMFVRPTVRGNGIGRRLCNSLITRARKLGYREVRRDALDRHVEALPLYRSLGSEDDPNPPAYSTDDAGVIRLRMLISE